LKKRIEFLKITNFWHENRADLIYVNKDCNNSLIIGIQINMINESKEAYLRVFITNERIPILLMSQLTFDSK
jgi:hypothetical protein